MLDDLGIKPNELVQRKAGILPYLTLAGGLAVVLLSNWFFVI